jgi:hypothetical protein
MRKEHHPKPVSFVPPLLRRKFVTPDNPREMGTLVMLIGFAILFVSAWTGISDTLASMGKKSAIGERVAVAPFRSGNAARMVGVYVFKDEASIPSGVRGSRVYYEKTKVPKTARVVWPRGRSQKAQVVFQHLDHLFGLPIGLGVLGFGLWIRRKRVDAFEAAMGRGDADV